MAGLGLQVFQRVNRQLGPDNKPGVELGVMLPLGNSLSTRVLKPRLNSGESPKEGQLKLSLAKGGNYRGVIQAGNVLHLYFQLSRQIAGELLIASG